MEEFQRNFCKEHDLREMSISFNYGGNHGFYVYLHWGASDSGLCVSGHGETISAACDHALEDMRRERAEQVEVA